MKALRYLVIGALVLAATVAAWWVLTLGLGMVLGPKYAGLVAVVIIVVAGWAANGLLLWRQLRRGRDAKR